MHRVRKAVAAFIVTACMALTLACGALSGGIPGVPTFNATETQDALINAATPASPASGDWNASIDGGQVTFHISRDGSHISSADLKLSGWHCGDTTLTTSMQLRSPDWSIEGRHFSVTMDLNPPHVEELSFDGAYDESTGTWSGTWDGDEYGSHCGGEWTASK